MREQRWLMNVDPEKGPLVAALVDQLPFVGQISQSGDELGGGVPLPASSHIIFLYDGFTASFNTPEWEHRHPTLFQSV